MLSTTYLAPPAGAQSVEELKAQIDALSQKVDELEGQQTATPVIASAQAVTAGDFPGSIKLPGTNTSFKVGGYVKGDFHYTTVQGLGDSFFGSAIPLDGTAQSLTDGHTRLHARQTRFNVQTRTPSDMGEVRTHIEGDFFGAGSSETISQSHAFRIRHAYGTIGNLLVGQTWSTLMHLFPYPDTIDFFGPTGMIFVRQAQIRYTFPFTGGDVQFAVENPQSILLNGPASASFGGVGANDDQVPDFVLKGTLAGDWGTVSVAGIVGALDVNTGSTAVGGAIIDET